MEACLRGGAEAGEEGSAAPLPSESPGSVEIPVSGLVPGVLTGMWSGGARVSLLLKLPGDVGV